MLSTVDGIRSSGTREYSNASSIMERKPSWRTTSSKFAQPAKVPSCNTSTPTGTSTRCMAAPQNANWPMAVKPAGKSAVSSAPSNAKAACPMLSSVDGSTAVFRLSKSIKLQLPIAVIPSLITIVSACSATDCHGGSRLLSNLCPSPQAIRSSP